MNARRSTHNWECNALLNSEQRAFTLLEILVVITIIGILMGMLGTVITNSFRKAREAATAALIMKIDGLLDERIKGFDRATKSRDFQRIVETRKKALEANGIFGVSLKVIEAVARKDYFRQLFPQRFEDLVDGQDTNWNGIADPSESAFGPTTNAVPDVLEQVPGAVLAKLQSQGPAIPTNPAASPQRDVTESSELLYFMLTRMDVFGVPPVGDSDFGTSEVRDTDGDGLLEFIDGWGRPLRFYRWPTRLLKPNGVYGPDGGPGVAGTDDPVPPSPANGLTDDIWEIGVLGSDDYRAINPINIAIPAVASDPNTPYHLPRRDLAGLLIDGLPALPATYNSGGSQIRYRYDTLDEDPDDPYGLIVSELKRLAKPNGGTAGINVLALGGYTEGMYPTFDTYHTPLIVSAGGDGELGLFEPYLLAPGQFGVLAQPLYNVAGGNPNDVPASTFLALTDNLTNRNRRAGRGK